MLNDTNHASAEAPPQDQIDNLAALYHKGCFQEVTAQGEALAEQYPRAIVIRNILGAANAGLGYWEQAAKYLGEVVQLSPGYDEHYNFGVTLQRLGRRDEAIEQYTKALQLNPDLAQANSNLSLILNELGRCDEAIEYCTRALQSNPAYAEAHNNLGVILNELGRRDEAIECCNRALQIDPDLKNAHLLKLSLQASICDWHGLSTESEAIASLGITGGPVRPFKLLALEDHPARHHQRSTRYAAATFKRTELAPVPRPAARPDSLRIGYFSADFRNHPVSYSIARLFELHDRDRFCLHAYSFGPNENDEMRARLTDAFDVFHDVRQESDKDVAELARKDRIDIAVDLNGYTDYSRSGIFAYRAAPIQINYLGYPGSMGAPFMDYIIADRTVIPENQKQHYSEKVIYLPDTYLVNDNSKKISDRPISRSELGLPETDFVFCCFNSNNKITAYEFDIWMRLLTQVDGSVLWLQRANKSAKQNLNREAQKRNIDPDRLIFAEMMPISEHLARHQLADLFLDTFNYNAHSTACDALWAGLPIVTKPGQGFPARVAASLLGAIGLSELITQSTEEYERLALDLAQNPEKLRKIKIKLRENRNSTPLFDTQNFTRNIEDAYRQAYQRYCDGLAPDTIFVDASN